MNGKFVTRTGSQLLLNGSPYRIVGPNIYWLGLDENVGGVDYPTEFRVNNVLDTAVEMGANVVRSHTLAASHGCEKCIMPSLGHYNEEALRKVDYAIKAAGDRGLKLIIPFVDNWNYYHGGTATFAGWRGHTASTPFYSDPNIINDFKQYIHMYLNRVNSYTGVAYKNDPTVLAWEVGNELNDVPFDWLVDIVDYIKSIDGNHLVAHGMQFGLETEMLRIPAIDIHDVHFYPPNAAKITEYAQLIHAAGKVFIVGEYGWGEGDLPEVLETIQNNYAISGSFYWSLFGHNDTFGFVEHDDGFTLHYPGSTEALKEKSSLLREHAFCMRGLPIPEHIVPAAPQITGIDQADNGNLVKWRGSAGAFTYTIERTTDEALASWEVVCGPCIGDHQAPWLDSNTPEGKVWYRMKAHNGSGVSGVYSDVYSSR